MSVNKYGQHHSLNEPNRWKTKCLYQICPHSQLSKSVHSHN